MEKPIVALITNSHGDVFVDACGEVTVVWVSDDTPHDRVFEVLRRIPRARMDELLGDPADWGNSEDDRQREVERLMGVEPPLRSLGGMRKN